MKSDPTDTEPNDPRAAAQYIEAMARGLKGLASHSGLPFLAYLLDMAEVEASTSARRAGHKPDGDVGN